MTAAVLPRRHDVVAVAEFEAEFVVFDPRVNRVHHVRDLAAVVWDACDGVTTRDALADEVCEITGAARAAVVAAMDDALALFRREGLLEGTEPAPAPGSDPADVQAAGAPPCLGCSGAKSARRRWLRGRLRR